VRTPVDQVRASHVVLALAAYDAARLVAPLARAAADELDAINYPSVASVALGFRRSQVAHPLAGFGALLPRRIERETLGVIFSSSLFPGRAPPGTVLLTAFIGGARNPAVRDCADAELGARVLADLRPLLGIDGDPIFEQVTLWSHAIPQYELGHLDRVRRIEAALGADPTLSFRANWRDGVSLADCVQNAKRAAETLT
jgi:oxygen-dependent protoporphyrinogen oxidase